MITPEIETRMSLGKRAINFFENCSYYITQQIYHATMDFEEICDLKVCEISYDNCLLFLWVTNPNLTEVIQVIKLWGFQYKTNMAWIKDRTG
jgi:N6-adenosine-specific RNA methylase IME4